MTEIFWAAVEFEKVRTPAVSVTAILPEEVSPLTVEVFALVTLMSPPVDVKLVMLTPPALEMLKLFEVAAVKPNTVLSGLFIYTLPGPPVMMLKAGLFTCTPLPAPAAPISPPTVKSVTAWPDMRAEPVIEPPGSVVLMITLVDANLPIVPVRTVFTLLLSKMLPFESILTSNVPIVEPD